MSNGSQFTVPLFQPNPHLFTDENGKQVWCKTCDTVFKSRQGAGSHVRKAHNMDIYGNILNTALSSSSSSSAASSPAAASEPAAANGQETNTELDFEIKPEDDETTRALKLELQRRTQSPNAEEMTPEAISQVVHTENSKDIASKAVQLVTDIDLMFLYHKTKRMFPPEYDFADWVRSCVVFTMNQFRIKVSISQDIRGLDDNMIKYFMQVNQDWIDTDKKLLAAAPQVIKK